MEIFSIVCLVIIMFGIQHLLNWFCRKTIREPDFTVPFILVIMFGFFICWKCIHYIILWGKDLI